MNNLRKIAWFNLKVLAVGVSLGLLIIAVSLAAGGVVGVVVAYAGFLVISIAVLITVPGRLLLLVRKKSGRVNFDERDDAIEKKSQLISHFLLSVIFLGTCLIAIPPPAGGAIAVAGLVTQQFVESIATLVQYGWGGNGNE